MIVSYEWICRFTETTAPVEYLAVPNGNCYEISDHRFFGSAESQA
jgi:hypothetical protein